MSRWHDYSIDKRFSTLTIEGYAKRNGAYDCMVICDCGARKQVRKGNLVRMKSCGCLAKEQISRAKLNRIDNNGNYKPGNCEWVTPRENANNRRSSVFVKYGGERLTIAQWAARLGIGRDTMRLRLINGWPLERALTAPLGPTSTRVAQYRLVRK